MIEVKMFFGGWKRVTAEQALAVARTKFSGIMTMSGQKCLDYINDQTLRGIRFTMDDVQNQNR